MICLRFCSLFSFLPDVKSGLSSVGVELVLEESDDKNVSTILSIAVVRTYVPVKPCQYVSVRSVAYQASQISIPESIVLPRSLVQEHAQPDNPEAKYKPLTQSLTSIHKR